MLCPSVFVPVLDVASCSWSNVVEFGSVTSYGWNPSLVPLRMLVVKLSWNTFEVLGRPLSSRYFELDAAKSLGALPLILSIPLLCNIRLVYILTILILFLNIT